MNSEKLSVLTETSQFLTGNKEMLQRFNNKRLVNNLNFTKKQVMVPATKNK